MESRSLKRKRSEDMKNMLADELHKLTLNSFQFIEDLQSAHDDFVLMFKSMGDRQSEIYARSIGLDEKYEELIGLIKGEHVMHMHVGETSTETSILPSSYCSDTRKFVDDSSASLDSHCNSVVEKVDEMIKEIEEQSAIWKGKVTEMKKQAEHLVSQRRTLAVQLLDFKKSI